MIVVFLQVTPSSIAALRSWFAKSVSCEMAKKLIILGNWLVNNVEFKYWGIIQNLTLKIMGIIRF